MRKSLALLSFLVMLGTPFAVLADTANTAGNVNAAGETGVGLRPLNPAAGVRSSVDVNTDADVDLNQGDRAESRSRASINADTDTTYRDNKRHYNSSNNNPHRGSNVNGNSTMSR